jgi:hypothetical protein
VETAVGQFHDQHEHAVEKLYAFEGEEEGVSDALDALDGPPFLGSEGAAALRIAANKLHSLDEPAGRLAPPHFAEAASAKGFDEAVARQRLGARLAEQALRR